MIRQTQHPKMQVNTNSHFLLMNSGTKKLIKDTKIRKRSQIRKEIKGHNETNCSL